MYIFCLLILRKKLLLVMFLASLATCFHIPFVKDGNNKKPSHKRATLDREAKLQQNMNIIIIQKRRRRRKTEISFIRTLGKLCCVLILLSLSLSLFLVLLNWNNICCCLFASPIHPLKNASSPVSLSRLLLNLDA